MATVRSQRAESHERVVDLVERGAQLRRRCPRDDGASRAFRHGVRDEVVTVEPVAYERHVQLPLRHRTRIRGHAGVDDVAYLFRGACADAERLTHGAVGPLTRPGCAHATTHIELNRVRLSATMRRSSNGRFSRPIT